MNKRARRFAFVCFVLAIQVACVIFYDLLRNDNQVLKVQRKMVERKAVSPGTNYTGRSKKRVKKDDVIRRDKHDDVINGLQKQLASLREQLNKLNKTCREPTIKYVPEAAGGKSHQETKHKGSPKDSLRYTRTLKHTKGDNGTKVVGNSKTIIPSDWIKVQSMFSMFTTKRIFSVNSVDNPRDRLTYRKLAKNGKYEHLNYALEETMSILRKYLNLNSSVNLTFKAGLYRDDVNYGAEYNIHVINEGDMSVYNVRLIRPLSPLLLVHPPVKDNLNKLVNIIVPLQGRLDRFQEFLNNFKNVCISRKENVFLTVVYSSKDGVTKVKEMLSTLAKDYNFRKFQLVIRKKNFNRGHALHDGVQHWKGEKDVLMFFCDVDMVFDSGFIDRCRTFTEPGRAVYYPIVFNLYNPKYVRQTTSDFWKILIDTGFWRYYGYGMTCQHRQDYFRVGGFDLNIKGWGSEDVELHRKYVTQANIRIIRAPDSGLFHRYHTKDCDRTLPWKQYRSCMSTKVDTEASKTQYGRRVLQLEESFKKLSDVKPDILEVGEL